MKRKIIAVLVMCCAAFLLFACKAKDSDTVQIGAIFPLSGPVAFYGNESRDGALLAIEEINAAGGLLGKKIALISEDDEGNAEKAVNAFTKLVSRNKVAFIIGSSTSGPTQAMTSQAQQSKVILISPSATNELVTRTGDYIFRACFIDPFQGVVGADFAFDILGSRNAAVLYDAGADYNTGLAESFRDQFIALGGQVTMEAYQTGDVDFNAQVTRIRASRPDVVYLPNYYNDVSLQAKALRDQGINCALVGGDGWDGLVDNAGNEVLNGFWSSGFAADTTDPLGMAFVQAFYAKYNGRLASQFAALGYDALMLVADGIKAAGTFDTAAVKNSMAQLNGPYITGNIRFDANRDPIKGAAILEIVRADGKLTNAYKTTVNPK